MKLTPGEIYFIGERDHLGSVRQRRQQSFPCPFCGPQKGTVVGVILTTTINPPFLKPTPS